MIKKKNFFLQEIYSYTGKNQWRLLSGNLIITAITQPREEKKIVAKINTTKRRFFEKKRADKRGLKNHVNLGMDGDQSKENQVHWKFIKTHQKIPKFFGRASSTGLTRANKCSRGDEPRSRSRGFKSPLLMHSSFVLSSRVIASQPGKAPDPPAVGPEIPGNPSGIFTILTLIKLPVRQFVYA